MEILREHEKYFNIEIAELPLNVYSRLLSRRLFLFSSPICSIKRTGSSNSLEVPSMKAESIKDIPLSLSYRPN